MSHTTCVRRSPTRAAIAAGSGAEAPSRSATVARTNSASRSGASGTKTVPPSASSPSRRASSIAKRVLPVPPGPTIVRARGSRSYTTETASNSSRSRPRKRVAGVGSSMLPGVRSGGNSLSSSWERRTGPSKSLRRCCPRSRSGSESRSAAVVGETRIWSPCASAAMRAPRWTSSPTYPSVVRVGAPVCRPMRTLTLPAASSSRAARAAAVAPPAVGKAMKNASPWVSTSTPS